MTPPPDTETTAAAGPDHGAAADGPDPFAYQRPWSGPGRDELAAEVRRLIAATVESGAPAEELTAAAAEIRALVDRLEALSPPAPIKPGPAVEAPWQDSGGDRGTESGITGALLATAMPFDVVVGTSNPIAPLMTIELDPPVARGQVTYTRPYEGAPGCVHGAILAGTFDLILTAANVIADAAGPTVHLNIHYRRPTLLNRPAFFEAEVVSVEGRRTKSTGRLIQDGVVTVEAEGEFAALDRKRINRMQDREGATGTADGKAAT